MDYITQREHFSDIIVEAEPLLRQHWREVAWEQEKIPLDIDYQTYDMLDKAGMFHCFSSRVGGVLVGYSAYFMRPNPHYKSTMWAANDVIFMLPEHRGHGRYLMTFAEEELRALGANVISYHVKVALDWGVALKRRGYTHLDNIWVKYLGD